MLLLHKIAALCRRCDFYKARCEVGLHQQLQKMLAIDNELTGLAMQMQATQHLLQSQKPRDSTFDRIQLFNFLRHQAVLRRQLQQLEIKREQLLEKRTAVLQERQAMRMQYAQWISREKKYTSWAAREKHQKYLGILLREENETQERVAWKR